MKKTIISILAIFVVLNILDLVMHGLVLSSAYQTTAHLWRLPNEIKVGVLYLVRLVFALAFVCVYVRFFVGKTVRNGIEYGFWFGLATAMSMGFGSYSVMPVPFEMALVWFAGSLIKGLAAGLIAGLILKD